MISKDIEIKYKIQQKLRKISYTNQKKLHLPNKIFLTSDPHQNKQSENLP